MTIFLRVVMVILWSSLVACSGSGIHIDAAGNSDGTASACDDKNCNPALTDIHPLPTCTEQAGSCPARSDEKLQVLLDAKAFGDSARFIVLGGLENS